MAVLPFITAVGSTLGNFFTGIANRKQSKRNLDAQMAWESAESEKQRQWNLDMWNMQNAYNSPREQMERLRAAGLNPNMAYGSGNVAGINAGSAPDYARPKSPNFSQVLPQPVINAGKALSAYQDYRYKDATINKTQAEATISGIDANWRNIFQAESSSLRTRRGESLYADNLIKGAQAKYAEQLAKYSLDTKEASLANIKATTRGKDLENDLNSILKPYGLTTRDNPLMRQIVRIIAKENPNMSAIDVALLLPSLIPGLGAGVKGLSFMRSANRMSKLGRVSKPFRRFYKYTKF